MADYGYFKDNKGNKKYINDDSIYHEGKVLKDVINSKVNASDVYTKEQLDNSLLPMTIIEGIYVGDSKTVTFSVEPKIPYIFINSHLYDREIVLITQYNGTINIDRILSSDPNHKTSFTLKDGKLTIAGAGNCRGHLYKLNYQITV